MKTIFKKNTLCFLLSSSAFLLIISFLIVYLSLRDNDYLLLGVIVFTVGTSFLIYFSALYDLFAFEIDNTRKAIQFYYPFSFKKKYNYGLTDVLGYYIFTNGPQRLVVIVFNDKKEYQFNDTYYSNFTYWQDYIFETYPMISHKNHRVYGEERKMNELASYISLFAFVEKEEFENHTFKLYGLLCGGIVGVCIGMLRYGFELNWFNVIAIILLIIIYVFIRNRKYISSLEKEAKMKEKETIL